MNKWDRVEKKKQATSHQDIQMEYVKMVMWILAGIGYFYFVIMGFHLWVNNQNIPMQERATRAE